MQPESFQTRHSEGAHAGWGFLLSSQSWGPFCMSHTLQDCNCLSATLKARQDCLSSSHHQGSPSPHQHRRMNFLPQQSDLLGTQGVLGLHSPWVPLTARSLGQPGIAQQLHRAKGHIVDSKISKPGNKNTPRCIICAVLPFPSDLHTQIWEFLTAKPAQSQSFLNLRAKKSPLGLQLVALFVVRKAQCVKNP